MRKWQWAQQPGEPKPPGNPPAPPDEPEPGETPDVPPPEEEPPPPIPLPPIDVPPPPIEGTIVRPFQPPSRPAAAHLSN